MKKLTAILFLFLSSTVAFSQWISTGGPSSRSIPEMLFEHDSIQYVSIRGCGIFSKNSATHEWDLQKTYWYDKYTLKGDSLYATIREIRGGIIRKDGLHLINLKDGIDNPNLIWDSNPTVLVHSDSCIYGTTGRNLFKLNLEGTSISSYNEGLPLEDDYHPDVGVYYFAPVLSIELAENLIYCGTKEGIYVSNSSAYEWQEINSGLVPGEVRSITSHGKKVYCSIENKLYQSEHGNHNWTLIFTTISNITSIYVENQNVFVGTEEDGIFTSQTDEFNWMSLNMGLPELHVMEIKSIDNELVCRTANHGIFYLKSEKWLTNNIGINCSIIRNIAKNDDSIYSVDWYGVHKLDNNNKWQTISPNLPQNGFGSIASNQNDIYLSIAHDKNYVAYSSDQGLSWSRTYEDVPYEGDDTYRFFTIGDKFFVSEDFKLFYTQNHGEDWIDVSTPPGTGNGYGACIVFDSQLYCPVGAAMEIRRLENDEWVPVNVRPDVNSFAKHLIHNNDIILAILTNKTVLRSSDSGKNWINLGKFRDLPDHIQGFASHNSIIFIASGEGIHYTSDYGYSWNTYNDGLINSNLLSIMIVGDTLYTGTVGNGVWKRLVDLEVDSVKEIIEYEFNISPNPCRNVITITHDLNNASLRIFDLHGKLVDLRAASVVENINTSNFPSGVYIIQLYNNQAAMHRKFIVTH